MAFAPFAPTYTPEPTRPSGGPTPGALELMGWTLEEWDLADHHDDPDPGNLGIYNPRDICHNLWPYWECTGSQHASGGALDVRFPTVIGGHPEGWKYARWLVANAAVLGVQEVIYGGKRWTNQTRQWRAYNGPSPHNDHVHVALNASGRRYLTRARIQSVAPSPTPAPAPPEDDDMRSIVKGDQSDKWWITDGITKRYVNDKQEAQVLIYGDAAVARWNNGAPFVWPQAVVNDIRTVAA